MILVLEVLAVVVVIIVVHLPGHGAVGDRHFGLGGRGGWFAAKVKACQSKSTGHDSGKDLKLVSMLLVPYTSEIIIRKAQDPVSHPSSTPGHPGWPRFWRLRPRWKLLCGRRTTCWRRLSCESCVSGELEAAAVYHTTWSGLTLEV